MARRMVFRVVLTQRPRALPHVWGLRLAVIDVHGQRGHEEGPALGHHRNELGVLVRDSSRARSSRHRPRAPCADPGRPARGTSRGGRARATRRPARASRPGRTRRPRGPWPARELAPPVVAHLMTSAPARTMVRTIVARRPRRHWPRRGAARDRPTRCTRDRRAHAVADPADGRHDRHGGRAAAARGPGPRPPRRGSPASRPPASRIVV